MELKPLNQDYIFCPFCHQMFSEMALKKCTNPACFINTFKKGNFVQILADSSLGRIKSNVDSEAFDISVLKQGLKRLNQTKFQHYFFKGGDLVNTKFGVGVITRRIENIITNGYIHYEVFINLSRVIVKESDILELIEADPYGELIAKRTIDVQEFFLCLTAIFFDLAPFSDELLFVFNSRVELMKHQVLSVRRVLSEYNPRFILADEVGLGKTLEAGLILKEIKARKLAQRVLIIVPANLIYQWKFEMDVKLNENFRIVDRISIQAFSAQYPDKDIWTSWDQIICSLQFARLRIDEIAAAFWDLIIFDEGHHLRRRLIGNKPSRTKSYRLAETLQNQTHSLLILTASPLQLHTYEFFSLLEIVDPSLFHSYELFEYYRKNLLAPIKRLIENFDSELTNKTYFEDLQKVTQLFKKKFPEKWESNFFEHFQLTGIITQKEFRNRILNQIRSYHLIGQKMIRNKKREVFPHSHRRISTTITIKMTEIEKKAYNEVLTFLRQRYYHFYFQDKPILGFLITIYLKLLTSSHMALIKSLKKRKDALQSSVHDVFTQKLSDRFFKVLRDENVYPESYEDEILKIASYTKALKEIREIDRLVEFLSSIEDDSKLNTLLEALQEIFINNPGEKVIIFVQFIATQEYLYQCLSEKYSCVVFNGKQTRDEKEEAVKQFKAEKQILISTEAGGEGRNFQFCHIMFNYDLPWNPMRVEQRIGRIDRIGQKRNVMIYNLFYEESIESRIINRLYERIGIFERTVGPLDAILGDIEDNILKVILSQESEYEEVIKEFEKSLEERIRDAKAIEEALNDFIMDTSRFQRDRVEYLLGKKRLVVPHEVYRFIHHAFQNLNAEDSFNQIAPKVYKTKIPSNFTVQSLRGKSYRGTFDLEFAKENEEFDFFALGHELVNELIEFYKTKSFKPPISAFELRLPSSTKDIGLFVCFVVSYFGLFPRKEIIPVFIGEEMNCSEKIGMEILREIEECFPLERYSIDTLKIFEMKKKVENYIVERKEEIEKHEKDRNSHLCEKEVSRLKTLYHWRKNQLINEKKRHTNLLERLHRSRDEKERRIIPAIKGRITKTQERIYNLKIEYEEDLKFIKEKEDASSTFELSAVAWVSLYDEN